MISHMQESLVDLDLKYGTATRALFQVTLSAILGYLIL